MATYLIGDLHGQYSEFERLLIGAGLCNENLKWSGGTDHLWLMGDFFDRGAPALNASNLPCACSRRHKLMEAEFNRYSVIMS